MRIVLTGIVSVILLTSSLYAILRRIDQTLPKMKDPHILILKNERRLQIFDGAQPVRTYLISLGFAPEGDKEIEGDGKTPEGDFYIFTKNDNSSFYLSLGVSYPNSEDAERGLKAGLITQQEYDEINNAVRDKSMPPQKTRLGGEIYIHGGGCDSDWTAGCIALRNEEMKEIFDTVEVGTRIKIKP